MGQYFCAANLTKGEHLSPWHGESGAKLTEGCYVGDEKTDSLLHMMTTDWRGDEVVFVGDYPFGTDPDIYPYSASGYLQSLKPAKEPYRMGADVSDTVPSPAPSYRYVCNLTKGVFYDKTTLPIAWIWKDDLEESPAFNIVRTDPLTLFMAIGNGLGGGDNPADAPGSESIGSWAGDAVEGKNERPNDLLEIESPFDEWDNFFCATDEEIFAKVDLLSLPNLGIPTVRSAYRAALSGNTNRFESARHRARKSGSPVAARTQGVRAGKNQ